MNRRDLLRTGILSFVAASAGCQTNNKKVDDVYLFTEYAGDGWQSVWKKLTREFEAENDLTITRWGATVGSDRLRRLIEAGDPPDCNSSSYGQIVDIGAHEALAPVTTLVERARKTNGELVGTPPVEPTQYIQVPHGYQADTLLYRTDVYEKLGLSVPGSFQELAANARAIEESDLDIRGYGLAAQENPDEDQFAKPRFEFQAYLARMGTPPGGFRWRDPERRTDLEMDFPEKEVTTLLALFKDLASFSPEPARVGWGRSIEQWVEGTVAQQYHLNNWPAGVAADLVQRGDTNTDTGTDTYEGVAKNTGVAPLPYWKTGNAGRLDAWVATPRTHGFHVFGTADNPSGARKWLKWLYADDTQRTARLYTIEPTRYLPNYGDVFESPTYKESAHFQAVPELRDQIEKIHGTIVNEHYGQTPEADFDDPAALSVARRGFYGDMVHRTVTGTDSVIEAYEYCRQRLSEVLDDVDA